MRPLPKVSEICSERSLFVVKEGSTGSIAYLSHWHFCWNCHQGYHLVQVVMTITLGANMHICPWGLHLTTLFTLANEQPWTFNYFQSLPPLGLIHPLDCACSSWDASSPWLEACLEEICSNSSELKSSELAGVDHKMGKTQSPGLYFNQQPRTERPVFVC